MNMFNNKVFIIGAGAHVPYGFPTSIQLTKSIKSLHADNIRDKEPSDRISVPQKQLDAFDDLQLLKTYVNYLWHESYPNDSSWNILNCFIKKFNDSSVYSIDRYLANRSKDNVEETKEIVIGKLLISYFIQKATRQAITNPHEHDWIEYLINNYLNEQKQLDLFFKEPPKIITFNYDNFLEEKLLGFLVNAKKKTKEEAMTMIMDLNILHVYGNIESINNSNEPNNINFLKNAIEQISVIGEERVSEQNLSEIILSFLNGKPNPIVYLLGYGYDELNNKKLFSKFPYYDFNQINFLSTYYDLSEPKRKKINSDIRTMINEAANKTSAITESASKYMPLSPDVLNQKPCITFYGNFENCDCLTLLENQNLLE